MVTHRVGLPLNTRFNHPQNVEIAEYYYTYGILTWGRVKARIPSFQYVCCLYEAVRR